MPLCLQIFHRTRVNTFVQFLKFYKINLKLCPIINLLATAIFIILKTGFKISMTIIDHFSTNKILQTIKINYLQVQAIKHCAIICFRNITICQRHFYNILLII